MSELHSKSIPRRLDRLNPSSPGIDEIMRREASISRKWFALEADSIAVGAFYRLAAEADEGAQLSADRTTTMANRCAPSQRDHRSRLHESNNCARQRGANEIMRRPNSPQFRRSWPERACRLASERSGNLNVGSRVSCFSKRSSKTTLSRPTNCKASLIGTATTTTTRTTISRNKIALIRAIACLPMILALVVSASAVGDLQDASRFKRVQFRQEDPVEGELN